METRDKEVSAGKGGSKGSSFSDCNGSLGNPVVTEPSDDRTCAVLGGAAGVSLGKKFKSYIVGQDSDPFFSGNIIE